MSGPRGVTLSAGLVDAGSNRDTRASATLPPQCAALGARDLSQIPTRQGTICEVQSAAEARRERFGVWG